MFSLMLCNCIVQMLLLMSLLPLLCCVCIQAQISENSGLAIPSWLLYIVLIGFIVRDRTLVLSGHPSVC